ncbi:MAG: bifunctional nuclease family protein [Myxococcota bacterium]
MFSITSAAVAVSVVMTAAVAPAEAKRRSRERVTVEDVLTTSDGHYVVILKTKTKPLRFLPIWVGETEAMQIRMQLDRRKPPRPLTLNLLQSVLSSSKITVMEATIDALQGSIFLGKLRLRQNGRAWEIDARPSDAVGLALGAGAAIFVSRQVLDDAAIDLTDLEPVYGKKPSEKLDATETPSELSSFEETL